MFIVRLFCARPRWGLGKWERIRSSSCPQGAPSLADETRRTPLALSGGLGRGAPRRTPRAGSGLGVMGASRRRWLWTQALKDEKEFVVSIGQKEGRAKEGPDGRRWEAERGARRALGRAEPRRPGESAPPVGSRTVWGANSGSPSVSSALLDAKPPPGCLWASGARLPARVAVSASLCPTKHRGVEYFPGPLAQGGGGGRGMGLRGRL